MSEKPIIKPITCEELLKLRDECLDKIKDRQRYELRNDAKLRAVTTTKSYEEFKDIVDAAHLGSITKQDKMNAKTKNHIWNTVTR